MKIDMAKELERRANSMQLSTGAYCKIILCEWIRSGKKLRLEEKIIISCIAPIDCIFKNSSTRFQIAWHGVSMSNLMQKQHTIRSVNFLNNTLFELTVERLDIPFEAGDCMAIYTPDGKSRPYSIASGTNEDVLRFLIRRLPQGEVTTQLANTKQGDVLNISPPFGWFRPGQEKQQAPSVFCNWNRHCSFSFSSIKFTETTTSCNLLWNILSK